MIAGRQVVTYADREEVLLTGDAFYMSPGHSPLAESGSEFVIICPTDELRATEDVIARNAQALHGA
jgi:hypothetical protein